LIVTEKYKSVKNNNNHNKRMLKYQFPRYLFAL